MAVIKRIKQAMSEFPEQASIVSNSYGGCKFCWMLDMAWCIIRYGARPIDYVRFEFHKKSGRERNRYLTIYRYFALYKKIRKEMGADNISGCKSEEYKRFDAFVKRDWMVVDSQTSKETIISFIYKYHTVIAKPNHGEQGHGVMKINESDAVAIEELMKARMSNPFVMEECLVNAPEIAAINESSLNTIRCYSLLDKNGNPHIMEIMLRVGLAGSHVDNWGSGGVGYCFDVETGICSQYGLDKLNRPYSFHPGSNYPIIGFQLPNFEELKTYINGLIKAAPHARYVGWDIAITPNGFDLVEMNCPGGHDFLQVFGRPWGEFIKKNW